MSQVSELGIQLSEKHKGLRRKRKNVKPQPVLLRHLWI